MNPIDDMGYFFAFFALGYVGLMVAWAIWRAWHDQKKDQAAHNTQDIEQILGLAFEDKKVNSPYQGWDPRD